MQDSCDERGRGMDVMFELQNAPATMDFRMNRVRIVVNENDQVVAAPARG